LSRAYCSYVFLYSAYVFLYSACVFLYSACRIEMDGMNKNGN